MVKKNINYDNRNKTNNEQEEEKYLRMFRDNPQPMWIYDLETLRFLEVNDAAISDYGYSRDEFLSMTLADIRPSEDVELLHENVRSSRQKYNNSGVWRHLKKNGEIKFVAIVSHEIEHLDRKARHVMVTDVTEELKYRTALQDSENNFRQLFENNLSIMLIVEPQTAAILDANNAAIKYYGYTKEELLNLTVYDINVKGAAAEDLIKAQNAEQFHFELKHCKKNGEIRDVEIYSSKIFLHGKLCLHSIIYDVTAKKMALDRIKLLGRAIEQSPVSVMITDPNGMIEYVNQNFTKTSGYTLLEAIGKKPGFMKSGRQSKEFYSGLWKTVKAGKVWEGEMLNKKKDGTLYWENIIISPVQNEEGQIKHFVAVKEDITESKAMLQNLILAKEQAEEANRIKSSFLNNMSHEFRTPLISILGYTELLKEEISDEDQISMLMNIEKSGNRLFETLKAILEISRIEGGRLPVNFELIDINEVVSSQCEVFEQSTKAKNIKFTKNIPSEKLMVSLDKKLFIQILDNLLDNALKFTSEGEIAIILQKNLIPSADDSPQFEVQLSVRDTGIGIRRDKQKTVFEDFRQASEGYSRSYEGSGLGLSVVNKFTQKMGGRVELQSEEGYGSNFMIYFPLFTDKTIIEKSVEKSEPEPISTKKHKVLLVEDDPMATSLINKMLNKICEVDKAVDGFMAIKKVNDRQYELILLDINLGLGMNGLAALNEIRKVPGYETVPVVAITAYVMNGFREYLLNSGCNDYLSKPFTYTQLVHTVNKWIDYNKVNPNNN